MAPEARQLRVGQRLGQLQDARHVSSPAQVVPTEAASAVTEDASSVGTAR